MSRPSWPRTLSGANSRNLHFQPNKPAAAKRGRCAKPRGDHDRPPRAGTLAASAATRGVVEPWTLVMATFSWASSQPGWVLLALLAGLSLAWPLFFVSYRADRRWIGSGGVAGVACEPSELRPWDLISLFLTPSSPPSPFFLHHIQSFRRLHHRSLHTQHFRCCVAFLLVLLRVVRSTHKQQSPVPLSALLSSQPAVEYRYSTVHALLGPDVFVLKQSTRRNRPPDCCHRLVHSPESPTTETSSSRPFALNSKRLRVSSTAFQQLRSLLSAWPGPLSSLLYSHLIICRPNNTFVVGRVLGFLKVSDTFFFLRHLSWIQGHIWILSTRLRTRRLPLSYLIDLRRCRRVRLPLPRHHYRTRLRRRPAQPLANFGSLDSSSSFNSATNVSLSVGILPDWLNRTRSFGPEAQLTPVSRPGREPTERKHRRILANSAIPIMQSTVTRLP